MIKKFKDIGLKFSKDFTDRFENSDYDIESMEKLYIDKLKKFIEFYDKYKPDGFRIYNHIDLYK